MLQTYREDNQYFKGILIAFAESFAIIFLFMLFLPQITKVLTAPIQPIEDQTPTLTIVRTPPDKPPALPDAQAQLQQQFMQTVDAQKSDTPPPDPKFFSAQNTRAASSSAGALPTDDPNQKGNDRRALGFNDSPQSAAAQGSAAPPQQQQKAQPQSTPRQSEQKQQQNQAQEKQQQEELKAPEKQKTEPSKNEQTLKQEKTASPQQTKPIDPVEKNPPPDIKAAERTAAPKVTAPALMSSESKAADSQKYNAPTQLKTDQLADEATISVAQADEKSATPQFSLANPDLSKLAALNPRDKTQPAPTPLANPAEPRNASSPASAPSVYEQRTRIDGGQTAAIRSTTAFDTQATPLGQYVQYVLSKIRYRWIPLVTASSSLLRVGTVRVKFDLMADGTVQNLQLFSDSNDEIFIGLCRQSILNPDNPPYRPFPPGVAAVLGDKKEFELSFSLY